MLKKASLACRHALSLELGYDGSVQTLVAKGIGPRKVKAGIKCLGTEPQAVHDQPLCIFFLLFLKAGLPDTLTSQGLLSGHTAS